MSRPISSERVFRALAHPRRRRIVETLHAGERSAGELIEKGVTTRAGLSQHLRVPHTAGVITRRRRGTYLMYQLNRPALGGVAAWVARHASGK
jgi:DNA-binding transcriptional ArsR family regulator